MFLKCSFLSAIDMDKIPDGDGDLTLQYSCKSFNTVVDKHAPYKKYQVQNKPNLWL